MCVFISFHRKGLSLLSKTVNVMPEFRSAWYSVEYFCIKELCHCDKSNHRKNVQAGNCAKECQLNQAKPREVKDNSYKLSKKNQR